jgi:uncharacterized repeat protein (TIGR03803 family)
MSANTACTTLYRSLVIAILTAALASAALAQTETVLHTFLGRADGGDGSDPLASLVADKAGNLYGTTTTGGGSSAFGCGGGCGTVFELSPPTTGSGGHWTETILYRFRTVNASDGSGPAAPLILDSAGNLYGSTEGGGTYGWGIVFELSPPAVLGGAWTEAILYNNAGNEQIANRTPLLFDAQGNLYGESSGYPNGNGLIFQLTPPSAQGGAWTFNLLFAFPSDGLLGAYPQGGLIWDQAGNLYGVAAYAGTSNCTFGGGGCGLVFELLKPSAQGGSWTFQIVHPFINSNGDGLTPNVVMFHNGSLYGTTAYGGDVYGDGTIFQLSPPATRGGAWTETILFSFNRNDTYGFRPQWGVIFDKTGNLYTTLSTAGYGSGATQDVFELRRPPPTEAHGLRRSSTTSPADPMAVALTSQASSSTKATASMAPP